MNNSFSISVKFTTIFVACPSVLKSFFSTRIASLTVDACAGNLDLSQEKGDTSVRQKMISLHHRNSNERKKCHNRNWKLSMGTHQKPLLSKELGWIQTSLQFYSSVAIRKEMKSEMEEIGWRILQEQHQLHSQTLAVGSFDR